MGHVLSTSIVKGSGDAAFDEAALAMVRKSDPVPPPPPAVADEGLSFHAAGDFPGQGKELTFGSLAIAAARAFASAQVIPDADIDDDEAGEDQRHRKPGFCIRAAHGLCAAGLRGAGGRLKAVTLSFA